MSERELISGEKAKENYGIEYHQLLHGIKTKELTVYSHIARKPYTIASYDKEADYPVVFGNFSYCDPNHAEAQYVADFYKDMKDHLFDVAEQEAFEKKHPGLLTHEEAIRPTEQEKAIFPCKLRNQMGRYNYDLSS